MCRTARTQSEGPPRHAGHARTARRPFRGAPVGSDGLDNVATAFVKMYFVNRAAILAVRPEEESLTRAWSPASGASRSLRS
jgi:hypothetical protein